MSGTFDAPTFWYKPEREVFCRSKAGFVTTNIEERYDTAPIYKPVLQESNPGPSLE